jgi:hypothetical protein
LRENENNFGKVKKIRAKNPCFSPQFQPASGQRLRRWGLPLKLR